MKVKNIVFSGFAAAILMGTATADASTPFRIASQAYVDRAVGDVANDLTGFENGTDTVVEALNELQTGKADSDEVGDVSNLTGYESGDTIVGAINDLISEVGDKADADVVGDVADLTGYESGDTIVSTINDLASEVAGKQDALTTGNGGNLVGAGTVTVNKDSNSGVITITGALPSAADASTAGVAKLYTTTGSNTDGSMTQAAITTALDTKANASTIAGANEALATGQNGFTASTVYGALNELKNDIGSLTGGAGSVENQINAKVGQLGTHTENNETVNNTVAYELAQKADASDVDALDALVNGDPSDNTDTGLVGLATLIKGYSTCITQAEALRESGDNSAAHCVLSASTAGGLEWTPVTFPWIED